MKTLILITLIFMVSCNYTGGSSAEKVSYSNISKDLEGYTWRKTVSCAAGCDYKAIIFYDGKVPMAHVMEYHKDLPTDDKVTITTEKNYIITLAGDLSGVLELSTDPATSFLFSATPNGSTMNICVNGACDDYERLNNGDL